ncbi:MAG: carbohydrate binding domain-containing protein, partial [Oscillospiraceae bacterium]|nr:carbohydrate binding domain-containing protein [Oscillospiraceae bacterium]
NILVSAFKHSPTQIEVVAINNGSGEVTQDFNVSGRSITGVDRYRTSANENCAQTKGISASGSTFSSQLPGKSVSTFIVSLESDGIEVPENPNQPVVVEPEKPDENGYYFHDTFEEGIDGWDGRGGATAALGSNAYKGSKALEITGREKQWHGAMKTLNYKTFEAGKEYSFSVTGYSETEQKIMLSLEYTDASGTTQYDHIGEATSSGGYVQISNPNYQIPEGASSPKLYVETDGTTGSFSIDEVIGAVAGTKVDGPSQPSVEYTLGDLNNDGAIDARDMTLAKRVVGNANASAAAKLAADVNKDSKVDAEDIKWFQKFLTGETKAFPA